MNNVSYKAPLIIALITTISVFGGEKYITECVNRDKNDSSQDNYDNNFWDEVSWREDVLAVSFPIVPEPKNNKIREKKRTIDKIAPNTGKVISQIISGTGEVIFQNKNLTSKGYRIILSRSTVLTRNVKQKNNK